MKLGETKLPKDENKKREVPPAGLHVGILFRIVDAGWCSNEYQGEKKMRTEGRLDFELWPLDPKTNQYITMADGRPFCVAPGFQGWLTFHKMAEVLTSWRGSPTVDSEAILGQPALLNIQHKPYKNKLGEDCIAANVVGVLPLMPGMATPEMASPPMVYSAREHDPALFAKLPAWIQKHIQEKSADWGKIPDYLKVPPSDDPGPHAPVGDDPDKGIPF